MKQNTILDQMEHIDDAYIREAGESRRARPNRRPLWIAAAAAVAALAILAGTLPGLVKSPDDPVADDPGTVETADPQPSESEYDVFSDPNVIWGEEDTPLGGTEGYSFGRVHYGQRMTETMDAATDENLIAFWVYDFQSPKNYQVDISSLYIPESLNMDGILTELLQKYDNAEDVQGRQEIRYEISCYFIELTGTSDAYKGADLAKYGFLLDIFLEKQTIFFTYYNEIVREWDCREDHSTETREKVYAEAEFRAMENERYRELTAAEAYYDHLRELTEELQNEWGRLIDKNTRSIFLDRGFSPVFNENTLSQGVYSSEQLLMFVGTKQQILALESEIEKNELIILYSPGDTSLFGGVD